MRDDVIRFPAEKYFNVQQWIALFQLTRQENKLPVISMCMLFSCCYFLLFSRKICFIYRKSIEKKDRTHVNIFPKKGLEKGPKRRPGYSVSNTGTLRGTVGILYCSGRLSASHAL